MAYDKRKFYRKDIDEWEYILLNKAFYKDECPKPSSLCRRLSELKSEHENIKRQPFIYKELNLSGLKHYKMLQLQDYLENKFLLRSKRLSVRQD